MPSIFDWSATDSSNTAVDGVNINTGMSPANVDNAFRKVLAVIRATFASALQNFLAGTAPLPIANGGTAATDAATALSNIGGLSSIYRDLVRVDKSSNFTFSAAERGYGILWTGGTGTATINPESTTPMNNGAVFVIRSVSGTLAIARGSGVTLLVNGATTGADATIAAGGQATLIRWGNDYWAINGTGVS